VKYPLTSPKLLAAVALTAVSMNVTGEKVEAAAVML
jgi:hypothetical protein